ncbi:NAD(P)H-dependent oxidoreductase [candidate division KSB1 bacterium]
MHIYIVFAHPSRRSFTYSVLKSFEQGLQDGGCSFETGDLYKMNFRTDMSLSEYERETSLNVDAGLPDDVIAEQRKIAKADALVFIYPVWWSDCPAKLKGWFDRVWTYGYAYTYDEDGGHAKSKINIDKALVICPAGHTEDYLEEIGIAESMRRIMLGDRLSGVGIKEVKMEILGGQVFNDNTIRKKNLEKAYQLGKSFNSIFPD